MTILIESDLSSFANADSQLKSTCAMSLRGSPEVLPKSPRDSANHPGDHDLYGPAETIAIDAPALLIPRDITRLSACQREAFTVHLRGGCCRKKGNGSAPSVAEFPEVSAK